MANLSKVIYINEEDYSTLLNGGTITKGGVTYSHDPTALYVIKNVSAPEYAETAGYATTAGQATKATQDGGGNVISETYAKKAIIGILTYNSQTDTWTCNKTHEELTNAILAGNLVYLTAPGWSNQLYYPKRYPYPDGNGDYSGVLLFQSLESGGYCERFSIYDDNSIENEEVDFESYLSGEGYFKQRIILKLTIGNNNTLSFKDQDDQNINIDGANWLIRRSQDERDVVIQYNNREYRKQAYESDNSSIAFVSIDLENYSLYYLSFDCSTTSTVTLIENTFIPILPENADLGQAYGISSDNTNSAARTSSISGFKLKEGGIVAIKFTTGISTTGPSLNISSTGAKSIYYHGSAPPRGTINTGDTVTFIYDGTYYHIISIDKDIPDPATTAPVMDGTAAVGSSTKYAKEDHVHPSDTTRQAKLIDSVTQQTGETVNFKTVNSQSLLGSGDINTNQVVLGVYSSGSFVESTLNQNNEWIGVGAVTPVKNKIYFDVSSATSYIWSGTSYIPSSNLLVVNVTEETNNNTTTYSADRTFDEIYSTWIAEKDIICVNAGYVFQLFYIDSTQALFSSLISDINMYGTIRISSSDSISASLASIPQLANDLTTTVTGQALDATQGRILKNMITDQQVRVGSVAGKLYRNDVNGSGNFTVRGNSGCIPNLTAGTFLVSIYAKSDTQSYTFKFNFGSVSYNLSTTNGEINDVREITIPSDGTFSGSVLSGSVASGTILYVVMYDYLTPVTTVGPAAVTNRYSDLDGTPTIPTVNNGTLTIQQNGITAGTFTANQSSNTTANIYSTMFGIKGQTGFERDTYNSSSGTWSGVEIATPDPLVTYVDISNNKLYRYDPLTTNYVELSSSSGTGNITSTAITNLTDIL